MSRQRKTYTVHTDTSWGAVISLAERLGYEITGDGISDPRQVVGATLAMHRQTGALQVSITGIDPEHLRRLARTLAEMGLVLDAPPELRYAGVDAARAERMAAGESFVDLFGPGPADEPVGAKEIAHLAGVALGTVAEWRLRHKDFPAPRWTVRGGPAWQRWQVVAWLVRTGRAVRGETP